MIAASHAADSCRNHASYMLVIDIALELGSDPLARSLALAAYFAVPVEGRSSSVRGEAAGILRDGWKPGQKVKRR